MALLSVGLVVMFSFFFAESQGTVVNVATYVYPLIWNQVLDTRNTVTYILIILCR